MVINFLFRKNNMTAQQNKPKLAKVFSKFTVNKIEAISALADMSAGTGTSADLGEQMKKAGQILGGTLSSLARTKINGQPLVVPLAKDPEKGIIWKLNENIASRKEIKETADNILSEVRKWRKNK